MGCCYSAPIDFDGPVDITHFDLCRSIGKGAFGKVRVVQHKKTKLEYALKYINKTEVARQGLANNMLRERKLLEEADNPFICNLRYAFQDDMHILMVLDLKLGGDLEFHLKGLGFFPEDRAKFYFAEISCALTYLHSLNIMHRDLKPGNVLLDEFGHASITDFNIATRYDPKKPPTSRSGTLAYMAPEVVNKIPYQSCIDWWSLGIMTYEMLFGNTPFGRSQEDETKAAIRADALKFPDPSVLKSPVSLEVMDLLTGLIERDVTKRLGSAVNGGDRKIRSHRWFDSWDWRKVEAKEIPPPFIPDVKNQIYFNPFLELEEVLFEDNPLQTRPVHMKQMHKTTETKIGEKVEESEQSLQLRLLSEGFQDFDFTKSIKLRETSMTDINNGSNDSLIGKSL